MFKKNKYRPYPIIDLPNRMWPDNRIRKEPIWCSVDLRDGNQALPNPMDHNRKLKLYNCLIDVGFKEIEVGFPSASATDYFFVRDLVENRRIPDDVVIQVLAPCRKELISKTVASLVGTKTAIIHLYNSTSIQQREQVFCKSKGDIISLALSGVQWMLNEIELYPETDWRFEYSPESFTGTELSFALEICNEVIDKWINVTGKGIIINLPSTVELSTPNIYADQIEWMSRNLNCRDKVCLSIHPHNDRGTATAAAELGLLAGADRIEGTLFGNGERTGNVDIVNVALNAAIQDIDISLNLRDIPSIVDCVQECTQMPIPVRHPYAGSLVFTAFSGSHQDAIRKSLLLQKHKEYWDVPYLPIEPNDIGRNYEEVIRVNSQSGKGGIGYLLEHYFDIRLPRNMLIELQHIVQNIADETSQEIDKDFIYNIFINEFIRDSGKLSFIKVQDISINDSFAGLSVVLRYNGKECISYGEGNGILDAFLTAVENILNVKIEIVDYSESAISRTSQAQAISFVTVQICNEMSYGVGINTNIAISPILALISAINRFYLRKR